MCLAICDYSTTPIEKQAFRNAARTNSDGMGLVYAKGGALYDYKTMYDTYKNLDEFYEVYLAAKRETAGTGSPVVIHFRMATHGIKGTDNCHPFIVNKDVAFIHNGVMGTMPKCEKRSDTSVFNDIILKKLPDGFMFNSGSLNLMEAFCLTGNGSKLVFLDRFGRSRIVNETAGHWNGETWYSNKSYSYDISSVARNTYGSNTNYTATNNKSTSAVDSSFKNSVSRPLALAPA